MSYSSLVDWISIPEGDFLMGSDRQQDALAHDNEMPQHRLHLPEYLISRTPVTNAQYQRFVEATHYPTPTHWMNGIIPASKAHHPVVYVSWHAVQAFCAWAGVRLPSEAEWEKAARGTDGRRYPWGNEAPNNSRCNFDMAVGDTTPVGQYPKGASPYGCLDMAGNVWEWMNSKSQVYPYKTADGREELTNNDPRSLRGGAFNDDKGFVRCAYREAYFPNFGYSSIGFRVGKQL